MSLAVKVGHIPSGYDAYAKLNIRNLPFSPFISLSHVPSRYDYVFQYYVHHFSCSCGYGSDYGCACIFDYFCFFFFFLFSCCGQNLKRGRRRGRTDSRRMCSFLEKRPLPPPHPPRSEYSANIRRLRRTFL